VRIQQIEKNARNARTIRSFDSSFLSRTRPTIARSNASQSDATRGVNILTFTVFFPSRCATDAFKALACLVGDARNKLPRELLISLVEFRDPGRRGRSPPTLVRVKIASTINVSFDVARSRARSRARRRCELRGHFNILTTSSRGAVLSFPHVRIGCFVKGTRPIWTGRCVPSAEHADARVVPHRRAKTATRGVVVIVRRRRRRRRALGKHGE